MQLRMMSVSKVQAAYGVPNWVLPLNPKLEMVE
jgi:hypothetical protein